jgi:hypothetical protein
MTSLQETGGENIYTYHALKILIQRFYLKRDCWIIGIGSVITIKIKNGIIYQKINSLNESVVRQNWLCWILRITSTAIKTNRARYVTI